MMLLVAFSVMVVVAVVAVGVILLGAIVIMSSVLILVVEVDRWATPHRACRDPHLGLSSRDGVVDQCGCKGLVVRDRQCRGVAT